MENGGGQGRAKLFTTLLINARRNTPKVPAIKPNKVPNLVFCGEIIWQVISLHSKEFIYSYWWREPLKLEKPFKLEVRNKLSKEGQSWMRLRPILHHLVAAAVSGGWLRISWGNLEGCKKVFVIRILYTKKTSWKDCPQKTYYTLKKPEGYNRRGYKSRSMQMQISTFYYIQNFDKINHNNWDWHMFLLSIWWMCKNIDGVEWLTDMRKIFLLYPIFIATFLPWKWMSPHFLHHHC